MPLSKQSKANLLHLSSIGQSVVVMARQTDGWPAAQKKMLKMKKRKRKSKSFPSPTATHRPSPQHPKPHNTSVKAPTRGNRERERGRTTARQTHLLIESRCIEREYKNTYTERISKESKNRIVVGRSKIKYKMIRPLTIISIQWTNID